VLAPILRMDESRIFNLFRKREAQSSTVIRPGLAIPHILVEGERIFNILIARSRQGIIFPDVDTPVHAMFVLIGTMDERNYHLRALMAIAQIAQGPDFDTRWLKARSAEELRNIILLAHRRRGAD
jgi:APA family basic amino acid/polyamine antiporter